MVYCTGRITELGGSETKRRSQDSDPSTKGFRKTAMTGQRWHLTRLMSVFFCGVYIPH